MCKVLPGHLWAGGRGLLLSNSSCPALAVGSATGLNGGGGSLLGWGAFYGPLGRALPSQHPLPPWSLSYCVWLDKTLWGSGERVAA